MKKWPETDTNFYHIPLSSWLIHQVCIDFTFVFSSFNERRTRIYAIRHPALIDIFYSINSIRINVFQSDWEIGCYVFTRCEKNLENLYESLTNDEFSNRETSRCTVKLQNGSSMFFIFSQIAWNFLVLTAQ